MRASRIRHVYVITGGVLHDLPDLPFGRFQRHGIHLLLYVSALQLFHPYSHSFFIVSRGHFARSTVCIGLQMSLRD